MLSLLVSVMPAAFAANIETSVETNEVVIGIVDGVTLSMKSKELENGNAYTYLFENGKMTRMSYIDRTECVITETDYSGSVAISKTMKVEVSRKTPQISLFALQGSTYAGRIGYDSYFQGYVVNTNFLDVSYSTREDDAEYDFMGKYKDTYELITQAMAIFNITLHISTKFVEKLLIGLGFLGSAADMINIPNPTVVEAKMLQVTWDAVNPYNTAMATRIIGERYTFVYPWGGAAHVETENSYYPTTSFSSQNVTFAKDLYWRVFPYNDSCEVVSWT